MDILQQRVFRLTLLFRGSKLPHKGECNAQSDEYIELFELNNLKAINLPILEFSFKNLDHLKCLLESFPTNADDEINGLIITSPRVVEALDLALQQQATLKDSILSRIDKRFLFVVGEKSAKEVETKLGMGCNNQSACTGSGKALADYIRAFCDDHSSVTRFNLVYPKGNLSDETVEDALKSSRIKLKPVVIYETNVNSSIESDLVESFSNLDIPRDTDRFIVNHTFFSPSGVDAFRQINTSWYWDLVHKSMPTEIVEFRYSAIGKTTEAALIRNKFEVFCVAERPNATCLIESLKDKWNIRDFPKSS